MFKDILHRGIKIHRTAVNLYKYRITRQAHNLLSICQLVAKAFSRISYWPWLLFLNLSCASFNHSMVAGPWVRLRRFDCYTMLIAREFITSHISILCLFTSPVYECESYSIFPTFEAYFFPTSFKSSNDTSPSSTRTICFTNIYIPHIRSHNLNKRWQYARFKLCNKLNKVWIRMSYILIDEQTNFCQFLFLFINVEPVKFD